MSSAFWCVERLSYLLPLRHCNPIRDLRHLTSDPAGAHVILRSVAATKRIYRDLCVRTAQQWAVAGHFQLFGRRSRQCDVQMIAQWMNYHSTDRVQSITVAQRALESMIVAVLVVSGAAAVYGTQHCAN